MPQTDMTLTISSTVRPRTVHVEHCMGTAFSIDIRDTGNWSHAIHAVVSWLHHVDTVFSTYKPDSDISRIQRGELLAADAHPDVVTVLDLCAEVQTITDGYFTAMRDHKIDPTGLVKGWAIEQASDLLRRHGSRNHAVNGGGDMQLAGEAAPSRPWHVGISDPRDRTQILTVITGRNIAVATSGTSERGQHITDPFTGIAAASLGSATIGGPSVAYADAYATAAFAMGTKALPWTETIDGYEAMLVRLDDTTTTTASWSRISPPGQ